LVAVLRDVQAGETVTVTKNGTPIAELVSNDVQRGVIWPGFEEISPLAFSTCQEVKPPSRSVVAG
jgi:antitoxin (DNA-binding transcriptional repressor) of toxin-antitoxin stability system